MNKDLKNALLSISLGATLVGGGLNSYLAHQDKNRTIATVSTVVESPVAKFTSHVHNFAMELERTYMLEEYNSRLHSQGQSVNNAARELENALRGVASAPEIGRWSETLASGLNYDRDDHNETYTGICTRPSKDGITTYPCTKTRYSDSDHMFSFDRQTIINAADQLQSLQTNIDELPPSNKEELYAATSNLEGQEVATIKEAFENAELPNNYNTLREASREFMTTNNLDKLVAETPEFVDISYNINSRRPNRVPQGWELVENQAITGKQISQKYTAIQEAITTARNISDSLRREQIPVEDMGETSLILYEAIGEETQGRPSKTLQRWGPIGGAIGGGILGGALFGLNRRRKQQKIRNYR